MPEDLARLRASIQAELARMNALLEEAERLVRCSRNLRRRARRARIRCAIPEMPASGRRTAV